MARRNRKMKIPSAGLPITGMEHARRMGEFLSFMGTELDIIIHSTKKRACETAQAITRSLRPKKEVREENGLAPNDDPAAWVARINEMTEDTAIVGHLPFLDRLLGLLVLGDADRKMIDLAPVGTVCLKPARRRKMAHNVGDRSRGYLVNWLGASLIFCAGIVLGGFIFSLIVTLRSRSRQSRARNQGGFRRSCHERTQAAMPTGPG